MSKFGDLLGVTPKPAAKPEPVAKEVPSKKEPDLSEMSKKELESYGRTLGIELDRRQSKSKLIKELKEVLS